MKDYFAFGDGFCDPTEKSIIQHCMFLEDEVRGGGGGKSWKLAASLVKEKGGSRSEERKREVLG